MKKNQTYPKWLILSFTMAFTLCATAADTASGVRNKNVTVISAKSSADGKSEVREELLEECIVSLPGAEGLEANVTSKPRYLKELNGSPDANGFIKTYSARLEINYMLRQKAMIIITTRAVQNTEPVIKIIEKRLPKKRQFTSNAAEGDIYAGRSRRLYYFSREKLAVEDVRRRAATWLKQQQAVVCRDK